MEKTLQRHPRRLQRAFNITRHVFRAILIRLDGHDAVPEVAAEEEILAETPRVRVGEGADRGVGGGGEVSGERGVQGEKVGEELGFVGCGGGEGCGEGAGRADGAGNEGGHVPHGADVAAVGELVRRVDVGDGGDVGDAHGVDDGVGGAVGGGPVGEVVVEVVVEGFGLNVGEGGGWGEFEEHGQEGVLEEDGLPELPPLLLVAAGTAWSDDVGVAVQAHGVGLADEDAAECPCVGGVVVVHEEIPDQDHGLQCPHRCPAEIR